MFREEENDTNTEIELIGDCDTVCTTLSDILQDLHTHYWEAHAREWAEEWWWLGRCRQDEVRGRRWLLAHCEYPATRRVIARPLKLRSV